MKFTSLSAALFLLASEASKVWAETVTGVTGPVTTVNIALGCPAGYFGKMRDVAFTIKPTTDGSGTKVSSNPPNLVTADYDSVNKKLSLSYTAAAKSAAHPSAGVTIEVPQTQLEEVSVGEQVTATVLQGFGSQFKEASAGNQASLFLTVDSPTNFEIIAEDQATINAKVTGTPSTLQVDASSQSTVSIQGAITKAEAKDQATLSILSGSSFPTGKVVADDQSSVEVDPSVSGGCSGVLGVQDDDSQADCSETSGGEVPFVGEAAGTGTMQCMGAGAVDVESNTKSYLRQSK